MSKTKAQKVSLLLDMIAFAIVDGELHEREYNFLSLIALELGIDKQEFKQLFHEENPSEIIKNEFKFKISITNPPNEGLIIVDVCAIF